ncbi:hypothetical protein ANANG_G00226650, partial [Anguilla anguilla]
MTTLTRQDLNFGQVVADILCEFLEVAIHLILYVREVYPSGIFQKRKKYNVPVQMSCHPELNQYIQDTLHCVKPLIEKRTTQKKWWLSLWIKNTIQWRDLCLKFPSLLCFPS